MSRKSLPLTLAALAGALTLGACAHQEARPPEPEPAAPPAAPPAAAPAPVAAVEPPTPVSCSADSACGARQVCVDARCVEVTPGLAACSDLTVHFGFDQSTLEGADLPSLQRAARCLAALPDARAVVAGHADERGTTEYNLALADRRAAAVKRYLGSLGADPSRVRAVSYGKERPLCQEHDEACWARNRRAEVAPGGDPQASR